MNKIKFDINFWNLDGLELRAKPNTGGNIDFIPISKDEAILTTRITILETEGKKAVLILNPKAKYIQSINLNDKNQKHTLLEWDNDSDFTDIASISNSVYLLDRYKGQIVTFKVDGKNIQQFNTWSLANNSKYDFSSSRIALIPSSYGHPQVYIGQVNQNQFLRFTPTNSSLQELDIKLPNKLANLGKEIALCVDRQNGTLIISDVLNHRLIEVDAITGQAVVIGGTGIAGTVENNKEGKNSTLANLNYPKSIVLYKPAHFIKDNGILSKESITTLELDPKRIKPRTILIADSENFQINKLVEIPFIKGASPFVPFERTIYPFIGLQKKEINNGDTNTSTVSIPSKENLSDLTTYSLKKPIDLTLSKAGELLIKFDTYPFLMFLQPATALAETYFYNNVSKKLNLHNS